MIAANNRVVVVSNSRDGFMVIKKIDFFGCSVALRESGKVREHSSGTIVTM